MSPELSIVIPVRNGEKYLAQSLASIPERDGIEVIVVDDGSTDGSRDIAQAAGAACLTGERRGPAACRNIGIRAARSPLLAFLDADDWWPPESLDLRIQALAEDAACQVAQGKIATHEEASTHPNMLRKVFHAPRYNVNLGACLFRTSTLLELGGLDESLTWGEDFDLFFRLWERSAPKKLLPQTCLYYRLHDTNLCINAPSDLQMQLLLLKRHKDRLKGGQMHPGSPIMEYLGWDQASA